MLTLSPSPVTNNWETIDTSDHRWYPNLSTENIPLKPVLLNFCSFYVASNYSRIILKLRLYELPLLSRCTMMILTQTFFTSYSIFCHPGSTLLHRVRSPRLIGIGRRKKGDRYMLEQRPSTTVSGRSLKILGWYPALRNVFRGSESCVLLLGKLRWRILPDIIDLSNHG